ncbi:MAG: M14-type cytosolic carboxypeptidase [Sphingomonas bacterium]|nr:M14-type cytosolic carboxypeptidase [Sphingomonas bacterium]
MTDLHINAGFDGGNIRVVGVDGDRIDLAIEKDRDSDFYQWFFFRVAGVKGRRLSLRIVNAGESAYPMGWPGYKARVTTDLSTWTMAPTSYADGVLTIDYEATGDLAWFAYFEPYTMAMHDALVARAAAKDGVTHRQIGTTLDGQAIDYFKIGSGAKSVWLYARQHPGESMAEWWMEGALDWLTSPAAADLLAKATVHVVPNMNPDGTLRGHLRTNGVGTNLNREWHEPSAAKSPEVLCVRTMMDETGVDFALDVHGDEAIAANFIAGFEGIPSWTDRQGDLFTRFGKALAAATPDFQTEKGYPKAKPGTANLSMSTNQLAERFGAVSVTLEMPFKDHDMNADPVHGWSGARSKQLAVSCLEVLTAMIDDV